MAKLFLFDNPSAEYNPYIRFMDAVARADPRPQVSYWFGYPSESACLVLAEGAPTFAILFAEEHTADDIRDLVALIDGADENRTPGYETPLYGILLSTNKGAIERVADALPNTVRAVTGREVFDDPRAFLRLLRHGDENWRKAPDDDVDNMLRYLATYGIRRELLRSVDLMDERVVDLFREVARDLFVRDGSEEGLKVLPESDIDRIFAADGLLSGILIDLYFAWDYVLSRAREMQGKGWSGEIKHGISLRFVRDEEAHRGLRAVGAHVLRPEPFALLLLYKLKKLAKMPDPIAALDAEIGNWLEENQIRIPADPAPEGGNG